MYPLDFMSKTFSCKKKTRTKFDSQKINTKRNVESLLFQINTKVNKFEQYLYHLLTQHTKDKSKHFCQSFYLLQENQFTMIVYRIYAIMYNP